MDADNSSLFSKKSVFIFILILAILTRIWGITWGLPHLYHVDEARFADISIQYFTGDLNPHFFHVPSLNSYVVAGIWGAYYLISKALGKFSSIEEFMNKFRDDPSLFMILGRLWSILLGIGTILLVYFIGKKMYNSRVGFIASLFLVFSPVHNKISHYLVPDGPMVFFLVLSFLFIWKIYEKGKMKHYILAGLFAGLATATKSGGQILFIPLLLAHVFHTLEKKKPIKEIFFNPGIFLSGIVFLAAFFAGCPYALLDFEKFWNDFKWQSQHLYQAGHFGSSTAQPAWLFYLIYGFRENIGVLSQFLVLGGILFAFFKRNRKDFILLSFPLVMFFIIGGWKTKAVRYFLPLTPFFILSAALFLDKIVIFMNQVSSKKDRWLNTSFKREQLFFWPIFVLFLFPQALKVIKHDCLLSQKDTRTVAQEWIEHNIPKKSKIALEMYGPPISRDDYEVLYRHTLSGVNLDWLHYRKIEYAVISDIMYARFTRFPEEFPHQSRFYNSLAEKASLIKTFEPKWDEYLIDLHNPTLKVFRLSTSPNFSFPGNFRQYSQRIDLKKTTDGKWIVQSALIFNGITEGPEKISNVYVRIAHADNKEVCKFFLAKGEISGPKGSFQIRFKKSFPLTQGDKIYLGYEYAFPPESLFSSMEKTPVKEFLLEEGIPKKALLSKTELNYVFLHTAFPNKRGDDYFQTVKLSKSTGTWTLLTEIFGGELRWGNDDVLNPFVKIFDSQGNEIKTLTVFKGKLGSFQGKKRAGARASAYIPFLPSSYKVFVGYENYYDNDLPQKAGGPEMFELRVPPEK